MQVESMGLDSLDIYCGSNFALTTYSCILGHATQRLSFLMCKIRQYQSLPHHKYSIIAICYYFLRAKDSKKRES